MKKSQDYFSISSKIVNEEELQKGCM